jgi:hypothetical protein
LESEEERPGWIWILTIQHIEAGQNEEDFEDEFGGDIAGCYATKELMLADIKKLGDNNYGMFHMAVEGWVLGQRKER